MERYDDGLSLIAIASKAEESGQLQKAYDNYLKGIELLMSKLRTEGNKDTKDMVSKHVARFMGSAEAVKQRLQETPALKEAQAAERQAREFERNLKYSQALAAYTRAAELYRTYRLENASDKALYDRAGELAMNMIVRAECMQRFVPQRPSSQSYSGGNSGGNSTSEFPPAVASGAERSTGPGALIQSGSQPSKALPNTIVASFVKASSKCTAEEKKVLLASSKINGRTYEFMNSEDGNMSNFEGEPFKDPDGLPKLSPKQKAENALWARPSQFLEQPVVIKRFSYNTIRQTLVGDCSYVSSLALCAAWEHRFRKTLISQNIYPQVKGRAVISPSGKYIIKMFLNGTIRKITIDDYLPVAQNKSVRLLCSFSTEAGELWVSLFEKAYIKLHGGYDFPGSTSSIDLFALCGWIPETFRLKDTKDDASAAEQCWFRLTAGHHKGTGLFTLGSKGMDAAEEERSGLVEKHAYAVLDVREACGRRVLKLKNPWCHIRWKGDFSPGDEANWTPELRAALGYDAAAEKEADDGVFWISWEAVQHFFTCLHASWSPERFSHRCGAHGRYVKTASDRRHWNRNPQYSLRVAGADPTAVWVLATRHYTHTREEPAMALHVYAGLSRVVYTEVYTEEAAVTSVYTNSPHQLVRVDLPQHAPRDLLLVLSLYDPTGAIAFSLTAYSVVPCRLALADEAPPSLAGHAVHTVRGQWDAAAAGGCPNHSSFGSNPRYSIRVEAPAGGAAEAGRLWCKVAVAPEDGAGEREEPSVGLHLYAGDVAPSALRQQSEVPLAAGNKAYRAGVAWREWEVAAGVYTLVAATFDPGTYAAYRLSYASSLPLALAQYVIHPG